MNTQDPLDVADNAVLAPKEYFGEVLIDTWFCALVKGVGKVPFDPAQHKQRFTAIKIDVVPLADSGVTYPISRELIAESKEWINFTLASLKALNVRTADIRNKFAKVTFVPTGEHYKNSSGEDKEKTALKFLEVYKDEAACQAAFFAQYGRGDAVNPYATQNHTLADAFEPSPNGHADVDPAVRAKLMPFVKMIVTKACNEHVGDLVKINDAVSVGIASHSTLKNYFTATDPDVMQLIAETATPF